MISRWRQFALVNAGLMLIGLGNAPTLSAGELPKSAGTIIGIVADPGGVAQMGATVQLFNRMEKLVQRAVTNEQIGRAHV